MGHRAADAVSALSIFVLLLVLVPSNLVFEPLGASGTPAAMLGMGLFVWWANAQLVTAPRDAVRLRPVRLALAIFAVSILLAYVAAGLSPLVPVEVRAADRGLLKLIAWAGIVLVAADGITSRQRLELLLRRVVLVGVALSVAGIVQFWTKFNVASVLQFPGLVQNGELISTIDRSLFYRPAATASHPLEFGVVLASIFPIALHFAFFCRTATTRYKIYFGLIAFALPLTVSRSAVLGIGVALVVLFAGWNRSQRITSLLIAPVAVVAVRLTVPGLVGTLRSLFSNIANDSSYTGRTDDYSIAFDHIARAPLTGRGFGTFVPGYRVTVDRPGAHIYVDNQYLLQLIEVGVIGLLALMLLFGTAYACARGARRRTQDPEQRHLAQALAASIAVIAVTFVTFDGLSFPMAAGFTMLFVGCAGALWRLSITEPGDDAPGRPRAVHPPTRVSDTMPVPSP